MIYWQSSKQTSYSQVY